MHSQWTSDFIQVWFFHRGSVPSSLSSGTPDTSTFGKPVARFQGSCNIDDHFYDHAIVFDLTFCGSWAGATFQDDGCPMTYGQDSGSSCVTYVAENPSAFKNSYWTVNSLKVYSAKASSSSSAAKAGTSAKPAASTTSLALTTQSIALGASSSSLSKRSTSSTSSYIAASTTWSHPHHGPPRMGRRHAHRGLLDW